MVMIKTKQTPLLIEMDLYCVVLSWDLATRQPLWVILCRLPEIVIKEVEEIVEEMKERDREERGNESEETEEIKTFPLYP